MTGEIVAIECGGETIDQDGCIRAGTSADALANLEPAFDAEGTVTAGASSPLTDGASAVLVCTVEYAAANKLDVLAKIKSIAVAGCQPEIMGYGPVVSTIKALERAREIDDEALAARAAEVEEACCPNGGHRRAQSGSCSLPNVCPSASCANTFVPFFEQCEAQVRE